MTEHEMEELIATYPKDFFPRKDMVLKGRQGSFSGVGRFDLWFEDEHGTNVLMELKARPAKYQDADQLAKYWKALEDAGKGSILMWLVATDIPAQVREFLDRVGIEYTEIHEGEYRRVAAKHNFTFRSDSGQARPAGLPQRPPDGREWHGSTDWGVGRNAAEFLSRCEPKSKAFFEEFFNRQKTMTRCTQITWDHESGFSMSFRFGSRGFCKMIWGFPTENRQRARSGNSDSLCFPFDFAVKEGVSEGFLSDFYRALADGVCLRGGQKRPRICVADLSQEEIKHILTVVSTYVEKAAAG